MATTNKTRFQQTAGGSGSKSSNPKNSGNLNISTSVHGGGTSKKATAASTNANHLASGFATSSNKAGAIPQVIMNGKILTPQWLLPEKAPAIAMSTHADYQSKKHKNEHQSIAAKTLTIDESAQEFTESKSSLAANKIANKK